MEIYPHDLGTHQYLTLLRQRLSPLASQNPWMRSGTNGERSLNYQKPIGRWLSRYWTKGLDLSPDEARKTADAVWSGAPGAGARVGTTIFGIYAIIFGLIPLMARAPFIVTLLVFGFWAALFCAALLSPRGALHKAHKRALDVNEIEALLPTARGKLETSYLNLVRDALQSGVSSAGAQEDIRAALQALGETVTRLPAEALPVQDSTDLRTLAQARRTQADQETDPLVRESLLRQAATLEKRIGTGDRTALAARRARTLRAEARTQMDALRAVLLSFETAAHADAAVNTRLSETVQRASVQAEVISVARQELEEEEIAALFGGPIPTPAPKAAPQQNNSFPRPAPQPEQQPQVVQRQWWRGGGQA